MEEYSYQPLADQITQIRLLQIQPADKADPISITIETYERGEAPPYAALSYTWGSHQKTKKILVNGGVLEVTENCWYALGQLRLNKPHSHFWIDAICIDQDDLEEKRFQVELMGETYRQAESCFVSLGRHSKSSAFLYKQVLASGYDVQDGKDGKGRGPTWLEKFDRGDLACLFPAFLSFGSHPYWSRLWIVQEFSLPRTIMLLSGSQCLPLEPLVALFNAVMDKQDTNPSADLMFKKTLAIRTAIQKTPQLFSTWHELLYDLDRRECSDPRDSIYGLLSLVDWSDTYQSSQAPLNADYTLSIHELAVKVMRRTVDFPRWGTNLHFYAELVRRLLDMLHIGSEDSYMDIARTSRSMKHEHRSSYRATAEVNVHHIGQNLYRIANSNQRLGCIQMTITVSSLVQLHEGMIIMDMHDMFEIRDPLPSTPYSPCGQGAVLVLEPWRDRRFRISYHGFLHFSSLPVHGVQLGELEYSLTIDEEDFLFWIWEMRNLTARGQQYGMLRYQFCRHRSSSMVILDAAQSLK